MQFFLAKHWMQVLTYLLSLDSSGSSSTALTRHASSSLVSSGTSSSNSTRLSLNAHVQLLLAPPPNAPHVSVRLWHHCYLATISTGGSGRSTGSHGSLSSSGSSRTRNTTLSLRGHNKSQLFYLGFCADYKVNLLNSMSPLEDGGFRCIDNLVLLSDCIKMFSFVECGRG